MIDLGGGCGGWVAYMAKRKRLPAAELALADSSPEALRYAAGHLPDGVGRIAWTCWTCRGPTAGTWPSCSTSSSTSRPRRRPCDRFTAPWRPVG